MCDPNDPPRPAEELEAALDAWAERRNEDAARELERHTRALIADAKRRGIDPRESGVLARAAAEREKALDREHRQAKSRREGGHATKGRRLRNDVSDDELRAMVAELVAKGETRTNAARRVSEVTAKRVGDKVDKIPVKTILRRTQQPPYDPPK